MTGLMNCLQQDTVIFCVLILICAPYLLAETHASLYDIYLGYLHPRIHPPSMKVKFTLCSAQSSLVMICFVLLVSCSPATQITGSWKDPAAKGYKDFFVAVLSKNLPARSTLEKDISSKLDREKVKATQSLSVFSHSEKIETEEERKAAVEKIQSLGHDAIITIALVNKTEESRYVSGSNSICPDEHWHWHRLQ